jgi:hypothetical protein
MKGLQVKRRLHLPATGMDSGAGHVQMQCNWGLATRTQDRLQAATARVK